jgi:hypothetical protein
MYIVKAVRWHMVERLLSPEGALGRRCSVCAGSEPGTAGETALDPATHIHYRVVRCRACCYDLLEPLATAASAAS